MEAQCLVNMHSIIYFLDSSEDMLNCNRFAVLPRNQECYLIETTYSEYTWKCFYIKLNSPSNCIGTIVVLGEIFSYSWYLKCFIFWFQIEPEKFKMCPRLASLLNLGFSHFQTASYLAHCLIKSINTFLQSNPL